MSLEKSGMSGGECYIISHTCHMQWRVACEVEALVPLRGRSHGRWRRWYRSLFPNLLIDYDAPMMPMCVHLHARVQELGLSSLHDPKFC